MLQSYQDISGTKNIYIVTEFPGYFRISPVPRGYIVIELPGYIRYIEDI